MWTFQRSSSDSVGGSPASSWPRERTRPSSKRVVGGLPRSWQSAPSITASCRGRSASSPSSSCRRLVHHLQRVRPHVPFGMPLRVLRGLRKRLELGRDRPAASPTRGASASPSEGRRAFSSSFSISPKTRSAGSSASGIAAQRRAVASSTCSSKRAANCTPRSARSGSSANVSGVHGAQHARRRGPAGRPRGRGAPRWPDRASGR